MKGHEANLACPACQAALKPKVLGCDSCGIKVEGPFELNEFATLGSEDLHFLRIFVQSEGRIRDMEAALGLSYPTIRNRLTALKNKLARPVSKPEAVEKPTVTAAEILAQLEAGKLGFEEAMAQIRKLRPTPTPPKK